MIIGMYYMLNGIMIALLVLTILFTEWEIIRIDRFGREYNASIFVVSGISAINMILIAVLAYQSWNIETLYIVNNHLETEVSNLSYLVFVYVFFFFLHIALIAKMIFEFWLEQTDMQKKMRSWDEP